ncbi:hypothetical protein Pla175_46660 [Pirellulimonas nuda]|uniref:Ice-binding protein C-terminal domain-containing protein n=1 Tax=Pirellulimonas nuda TaxID=2528009 RepID=A0A518DIE7_9BACT|nr:PEP-CTERM sorting domain-containing protein [Pirellulimonas nuda]QDU91246.1 hypothetical protein Pla175_46660 [Pirellulimonas nuda]
MTRTLPRFSSALSLATLTAGCLLAGSATAAVSTSGDVFPSDNPFTAGNEGLPTGGNTVDFNQDVDTPQANYEEEANVTVGRTGAGQLSITAGSVLRYGHLVIGGNGGDGGEGDGNTGTDDNGPDGNGQPIFDPDDNLGNDDVTVGYLNDDLRILPAGVDSISTGNGVVTITGSGSLYNNAPNVIPGRFLDPDETVPTTLFPVPDDDRRGTGTNGTPYNGFDAYVGLTGTGTLQLLAGGRVELQDALIVGYGSSARGLVTVSGQSSYLEANGGTVQDLNGDVTKQTDNGPNQMIIGGYGFGELRISEGGTVVARNGAAIGTTSTDPGASTTTNQFTLPFDTSFTRKGIGGVVVEGPNSVWNIIPQQNFLGTFGALSSTTAAALAVGEYVADGAYTAQGGAGTLTISAGGTVNVRQAPISSQVPGTGLQQADVIVGRYGTIVMDTGLLSVTDQVITDGLIRGSGTILTGTFRNRQVGQVRVLAGERLVIAADQSTPDAFDEANVVLPQGVFLGNIGTIDVLGTTLEQAELEFQRAIAPGGTIATAGRFINQRDNAATPADATDDVIGQINLRDGTLRFRSGLANAGQFTVVSGQNLVSGLIFNNGNMNGTVEAGVDGSIVLTGASRTVFENQVTNFGSMVVNGGSQAIFNGAAFQNVGVKNVQNSNIVYSSGVVNGDANVTDASIGMLRYTGGPINVTGTVLNRGNADAVDDATDSRIFVTNQSALNFDNLVTNDGVITILGDSTVSFSGGLVNNGVLVDLNPTEIYVSGDFDNNGGRLGFAIRNPMDFTEMTVAGDATFASGGLIDVTFVSPSSLAVGQTYNLLTVFGTLDRGTAGLNLLPSMLPGGLGARPVFTSTGFSIEIISGAAGTLIGDLNGDNIVDQADLDIWSMNVGVLTGATPAIGDTDGDGDVDGADYFNIFGNLGAVIGIGSIAAVPEPSACVLMLLAGAGLLAARRKS